MATLAVNLMASTAVSALTAALSKPKARQPGIIEAFARRSDMP